MELPVLDKFCYVFDLKTGCIIIGVINAVMTLIHAILLTSVAVDMDSSAAVARRLGEGDEGSMSTLVYTMVVLMALLLFLKFLADVVFVYSVYREKTSMIKKYCIFWMVFLVLFIIGFLKTLFHMEASHVIAQLVYLAVNFYFIVTIRSYLLSINEAGVL
ncbi:unnamed protein product [Plutella xylostella]|uniref:(diamondback moth) hypothetical protein n=1 Tax=Plutella xylostella TaxID=51655 RepID=A0A8S4F609_PLUXY|nr:unnamed protein product [Plutella xylostella]